MVGALVLPAVGRVVADSAALLALAINEGAGDVLTHSFTAVAAQNIMGTIIVGNKLEVLILVLASGLLSATGLALAINVDAAKLVYSFSANGADDLVGAMVGALVLPAVGHVATGSAALLALAINIVAGNILAHSFTAAVAQNIVGAVVVSRNVEFRTHVVAVLLTIHTLTIFPMAVSGTHIHIGAISEMAINSVGSIGFRHVLRMISDSISRKCRRNHRKRHSTRYNKRQQTAYFFHLHKPNLLYKNNTILFIF